jgi:hypothetical protein
LINKKTLSFFNLFEKNKLSSLMILSLRGFFLTKIIDVISPCIIIRFKQINQQDATVSQVYYLTFMCGLTCFGLFLAHRQELTTALAASGFTVGAWW